MTKEFPSEERYIEEIMELTLLLRREWSELNTKVTALGIDPGKVMLVSYLEDEFDGQFGVLVGSDGVTYRFENTDNGLSLAPITGREQLSEMERAYPQVLAANKILSTPTLAERVARIGRG